MLKRAVNAPAPDRWTNTVAALPDSGTTWLRGTATPLTSSDAFVSAVGEIAVKAPAVVVMFTCRRPSATCVNDRAMFGRGEGQTGPSAVRAPTALARPAPAA